MAVTNAEPDALGLTTVAARAILGQLEESGGRADQVARRLEQAICLGLLRDGERLPPEARLASQVRVATVTLREALAVLRRRGLVQTRRGRGGGTFVVSPAEHSADGLGARLAALSTHDIRDLSDHRTAIEGTAAGLAARRALADEVDRLGHYVQRLRAAGTVAERGRTDAQFAIELVAASQSPRLTAEQMRLRAELGDLLWWRLGDREHAARVAGRSALVAALRRRDATRARTLAERHVADDTARLLQLRLSRYDEAEAGR